MHRRLSRAQATVLAGFFLLVATLSTAAVWVMGREQGWMATTVNYETAVENAGGLRVGTKVRLLGVPVGQVQSIVAPTTPGEPVVVHFWVRAEHAELIRHDAEVRLERDGWVSERVLEIEPGSPAMSAAAAGSRLLAAPTADWQQLASRVGDIVEQARSGDGSLGKLLRDPEAYDRLTGSLAKLDALLATMPASELRTLFQRVDGMVADVEAGKGTLGKLLTDEETGSSIGQLTERAEAVMGSVAETNQALKESWPLRNFLGADRYATLIRPDEVSFSHSFAELDLFHAPGSAILTTAGRARLERVAAWIREFDEYDSEVVIAGFLPNEKDGRFSERTSSAQAEAVRRCLVDEMGASRRGWFRWRTITALGLGNARHPDPKVDNRENRLEVIVFLKT